MKTLSVIAVLFCLLSCGTAKHHNQDKSAAWDSFAYEGFGKKISSLASPSAVDCGVINQIDPNDPANQGNSLKKAHKCIRDSSREGQPFKFATVRIPSDSFLFEAIALTPNNDYWIVQYDYMLDGSSSLHDVKRCKGIKLDSDSPTALGIGCVNVSTADWLADIPEQQ